MSIERTQYGTYRVRWRDEAGKDRARSFKKKAEAKDFETKLQHDLRSGAYVDRRAGAVALAAWSETWLKASLHLGAGGRETYKRDLEQYILPELGEVHLVKLTPDAIEEFLSDELDDGLAASSVHRHYRTVNTMLKAAVERGKLQRNPCDTVKPPKVERAEMLFLDVDQVEALADNIAAHYRAWVLLAAYGGMRWAEGIGLRRSDLVGDRLTIAGQLKRRAGGEWVRSAPKTAAGRRTITIPASVAAEVEAHVAAGHALDGPDGLLFPNQAARPTNHPSFTGNVFKPALVRAGIEVVEVDGRKTSRVRIHDLRHTSVALAVKVGAHPKAIQSRMGHASITVTLDRYGHLFSDIDETIAGRLDDLRGAA